MLAARAAEAAQERVLAAVVQPRIEGHIATYRMALDVVDELHQRIADGTNIDLLAATRWAAMWQLAGRTLGFARAVVTLAEAGIGDDGTPVARGVHEASRMLEAVSNMNEKDIAVRWVVDDDDRYPKPHEVRAAIERVEKLMNDMLVAEGHEPVPTSRHLSAACYRRMSGATHNRRYATSAVVDPRLRRMARGRHDKARGRAAAVRYAGSIVNEAVSQTGACLALFLGERAGQEWLRTTLRPTIDTFAAVDADQALDDDAITAAARAAQTS